MNIPIRRLGKLKNIRYVRISVQLLFSRILIDMVIMKRLIIIVALFSLSLSAEELRGIWLSRNELGTKAQIAAIMDSLAANNFNTVLINCWSRGYPLFPSETFFKHTGMYIDPAYEGRDILAEAIAEGHRRGLSVEAWFEYGLVG